MKIIAKTIHHIALSIFLIGMCISHVSAQAVEGIVCLKGSNQRLSQVTVLNRSTGNRAFTNEIGIFKINAKKGDTIECSGTEMQTADSIYSGSPAMVVYLSRLAQPTVLSEVTINATTLKQDIQQTKRIYRSKGVFYTGTPHYYYLFLKPMTFIYENFKGEVIAARKFRKLASKDLEGQEIGMHFNRSIIKSALPAFPDNQIDDFLVKYWPTVQQVRKWSYYDAVEYVRMCYSNSFQQHI